MKEFVAHQLAALGKLSAGETPNVLRIDRLEVEQTGSGGHVYTVGGEGKGAQQVSVEAAANRGAVCIANQLPGTRLRVADEDVASQFISEADGDYFYPQLRRLFGCILRERILVFAVGDEENRPSGFAGCSRSPSGTCESVPRAACHPV